MGACVLVLLQARLYGSCALCSLGSGAGCQVCMTMWAACGAAAGCRSKVYGRAPLGAWVLVPLQTAVAKCACGVRFGAVAAAAGCSCQIQISMAVCHLMCALELGSSCHCRVPCQPHVCALCALEFGCWC